MECIFNETRYTNWNASGTHVRQWREDVEGNRLSFLPYDNAVNIEATNDGRYIATTSRGEVIAVSNEISTVLQRIIKADSLAEVMVEYGGESITLDRYYELIAPTLYRIIYSDSEEYGELITMDIYERGEASDVKVFDSLYDVADYIRKQQGDNGYYYVAKSQALTHEAIDSLGIEEYEMTDKERQYQRLRTMMNRIRKQQREGAGDITDEIE